jgi:hypothetical protein
MQITRQPFAFGSENVALFQFFDSAGSFHIEDFQGANEGNCKNQASKRAKNQRRNPDKICEGDAIEGVSGKEIHRRRDQSTQ